MKVVIAILLLGFIPILVKAGVKETYVGCEKEKVVFRCHDKMAPDINSAVWGRQDGVSCPPTSGDMNAGCQKDVLDLVRAECNLKKCALRPNERKFGKACDGQGKHIIMIEYECRPLPTTTEEPATTTTTTTTTSTTTPEPVTGDVRLYGGPNRGEGVAQIFRNGEWGTICDHRYWYGGWPSVLCRELGYLDSEYGPYAITHDPSYQSDFPINFQGPYCFMHDRIEDCEVQEKEVECGHDQDVYIACNEIQRFEGEVRLGDGPSEKEGIAHYYTNGSWGLICDTDLDPDGWPQVFCKDLSDSKPLIVKYATEVIDNYSQKGIRSKGPHSFQSPRCNTGNAATMKDCGQAPNPECRRYRQKDIYIKCE